MRPAFLPTATLVLLGFGVGAAAQYAERASAQPLPPVVEAWANAWNDFDARGMAALFTEHGVYRDEAFQATFAGRDAVAAWVEIGLVGKQVKKVSPGSAIVDRPGVCIACSGAPRTNPAPAVCNSRQPTIRLA